MTTPTNSTLMELREMNVAKQKEAAASHTTSHILSHTDSHISDNTTIFPDSSPANHQSNNMTVQSEDRATIKLVGRKPGRTVKKLDGLPSNRTQKGSTEAVLSASIRDRILAEVRKPEAPQVVLKTVTIKMDPILDKRIEDHCHAFGKKKQDVIRDAVLLYFETIGAAE